tara:strand:+ start:101 stop:466 length:366 start_codon:yes stop_codon:yes gene_type:complete
MEAILKYRRPHPDGHGPEVVDVVCPACSETRTLAYDGWSAIVCSNCGQELQHPCDELPTLSAGESLAIKVRVIRDLMQNDHRSMTEPNQPGPISYADRLESLARVLSQAIEEFDESQPKPF